jgi:hypothetical protein
MALVGAFIFASNLGKGNTMLQAAIETTLTLVCFLTVGAIVALAFI